MGINSTDKSGSRLGIGNNRDAMLYGHAQMVDDIGSGLAGTSAIRDAAANKGGINSNLDNMKYDPLEDKNTTNLYLCGISPEMHDKELMETFGKFGALASVKILYPKSEEERLKNKGRGNSGFICFMTRDSAEEAKLEMDQTSVKNYKLKVQWAKSIKALPYTPIYFPEILKDLLLPPKNYDDFPMNAIEGKSGKFRDATIKVTFPLDKKINTLINRTIEFVVKYGPKFEAEIKKNEQNNTAFRFLTDYSSPEHIYYRWRLWSLMHGESVQDWSEKPFKMFIMGPWWKPPPVEKFKMPGQKERIKKLNNLRETSRQLMPDN